MGQRERTSCPSRSWGRAEGVTVSVRDPPASVLAPVDLRHTERVGAGLTVHGYGAVLQAGGVGHVANNVEGLELELVGRAVGEALAERGEEDVDLRLTERVAPRAKDTDRLVTRPQGAGRGPVAVVARKLGLGGGRA